VIGESLSHYRIVEKIGAGGMGEVYRAEDTKLGRPVAIKVLPPEVSQDPERLGRFQREAQLLAALSHANIGAIYGLEDVGEQRFLVLEHVEGQNLAERLKEGPVPVAEALDLARQIAEAVEEAHEHGIVHRDLKPANVMLTPEGKVKVLDFGLAKAWGGENPVSGSTSDLSKSPTLAYATTGAGLILGTAAYMSPEQARGRPVDRRADIWSFGVVVFEMLTGESLFSGETISDTLASILKEEPSWEKLPAGTPRRLERLLYRCLAKNPRRRLRDIGDARLELEEMIESPEALSEGGVAEAPEAGGRLRGVLPWAMGALVLVVGATAGYLLRPAAEPAPVIRASIPPPDGTRFSLDAASPGAATLSPDGRKLVFAAQDDQGQVLLYVRPLDASEAYALSGTEEAQYPFWSPDGRFIGFFGEEKLKKIDAGGGPPLTLCEASNGKGGTWGTDGTIIFSPSHNTPLHRVSDAGGEAVAITELDRDAGENSHRHPRLLPGGTRVLYLARRAGGADGERGAEGNAVMVAPLDGGQGRLLLRSEAAAEYASGYLLFLRDETLMAQPFDPVAAELSGEPVPVAEGIGMLGGSAFATFTVSANGVLAHQKGAAAGSRRLRWFGLHGEEGEYLGEPAAHRDPRISPDGRWAVTATVDPRTGTSDLWVLEIARQVATRLTSDPGNDQSPVWTRDSASVVFQSDRSGSFGLYRKKVGGFGDEEGLLESPEDAYPSSVSPDGRWLLYGLRNEDGQGDLWVLPLDGEGEPRPVLQTPTSEWPGAFSPDQRFVTYFSNESGRWEIYVVPFPEADRKWRVSTNGAVYPEWMNNGRGIVYQELGGRLVEARVEPDGAEFRVVEEQPLFELPAPEAGVVFWALAPDDERVLVVSAAEGAEPESSLISLVVNWPQELAGSGARGPTTDAAR
jgi:Tol biopolymer transport system component/aminoglycoside phosphotransferase (APT) family kinase protein